MCEKYIKMSACLIIREDVTCMLSTLLHSDLIAHQFVKLFLPKHLLINFTKHSHYMVYTLEAN